MDFSKIPPGRDPPDEINVIVEIPQGGPIKYEFDHDTGALFVDRFLPTSMHYPGNYGFVPQTLAPDGDPLDVLVLAPDPVLPGAIVRCRPIAVLLTEDENGGDDKIIAVPIAAAHPAAAQQDALPPALRDQIAHFFAHYKDLEPGKWVKIRGWGDAAEAARLIATGIAEGRKATS